MNQGTRFTKRCLALLMAAILVASNFSGLAQFVRAEEIGTEVSVGEIIANNYDLTEAEKELLKSGLLAGGSFTYTAPGNEDGLVSAEDGKIAAKEFTDDYNNVWKPTAAVITYGGNELDVSLVNGEGTYDVKEVGNAFSVNVTYTLTTTVNAETQELLLNAPAYLKQGIQNLDDVAAQGGNLFILEQAMPHLVDFVKNGIEVTIFGATRPVKLDEPGASAVLAMNEQMAANGGKLNLSAMVDEYDASSKTGYLMNAGVAMEAEVDALLAQLIALDAPLKTISTYAQMAEDVDAEKLNQFNNAYGIIKTLTAALTTISEDPWTAANLGTTLVTGIDYATLDALVAALGETEGEALTVTNPLHVADATVQLNMSMFDVTVKVALNVVKNNAIVEYGYKDVVLTLVEGATADEILAAVQESGIEADAIAAWGETYKSEHYVVTQTDLPETLTADITYAVTYNPVEYTVTIADESVEYPYGYEVILPVHEDATKSYDYEDSNGTKYAQGTTVPVESDMTFTREEGKAYSVGQLYAIIAENYGTDKAAAILNSGALLNDVTISYREPSKAELEGLVVLNGNVLTVKSYASDYEGLDWVPYSYVVDGTEKLFDGATEVDLGDEFMTVNVYYRLVLTNYAESDVKDVLDLVVTLVDEAEGQKKVMDKLAGYEGQMGQLNKNMLTGLSAVIGNYSTENGGGLHDDPTTNDELVAYFQKTIGEITAKCCDGQTLKLYNIILAYSDENNGGLGYYYQNDETIRNEIAVLSGYLNDMLDGGDRQAALEKLMAENGYSDKVATLTTLKDRLAEVASELKPVNAAIDTSNPAKLSALAKALAMEGSVEYTESGSPYIEMGPVIRTAARFVTVEIKVNASGKSETFSVTIEKNKALTQAQVNDLKSQIATFVNGAVEADFYTNNYNNGAELDALVGVALSESKNYAYTWTAKEYTVKINGEADQTVNINNLTITLPAHPNAANGMSYEYTIGSKTATAGIYTFSKDELNTLFVNGEFTITRIEKNANVEQLEKMVAEVNKAMGFEALTLVGESGAYTGIVANVTAGEMMDLVMNMVLKSGYGYIGLNNEGFIYSNEKAELEICIQTLVNAMLKDNGFGSDRLIALGENGKGTLLTASMQLGNSAEELQYNDLTFTINFASVPSQMGTLADALVQINPYLSFQSNNGILDIEMNLPDKVYGAYLAALLTTGYADKNDMNAVDQEIAFMFLCDYLTAFIDSGADLVTLENTIAMLGKEINLSQYNNYYNSALKYLTYSADADGLNVNLSVPGQSVIDKLLSILGANEDGALDTYLGMVKEYKNNDDIIVNAHGLLKNTEKNYNALILDAQASGIANKFVCTTAANLNSVAANLSGASVIILLDDVTGDLHIAGTTILDLNGKSVSGNIYAEGTLYIMDSNMDTYAAGTVGSVSGNATIVAGNYGSDVSAFLKDGYYMDDTTVRNALYHIEADADGNVTFVVNTDVIEDENVDGYLPDVRALALDMVSDLILNYFTTAAMTVDGNTVYNVAFDDLIALLASSSKADDVIAKVLNSVDASGISGLTNTIIGDLLNFEALYEALNGDGVVATYGMTVAPWMIGIDVHEDNYLVLSVLANTKTEDRVGKEESFNVSLKLDGDNTGYIKNLVKELAGIVEDDTKVEIEIEQPTYADKEFNILVNGNVFVNVDMSANTDYGKILGVILAYGNADKRAAVAEAINNNDMEALKAVVDSTTVAELFTALKVMSRNVNFATMASTVGVTVDVSTAATLENVYHLSLCASGKALEELDITGMSNKLGALYNETEGRYELTRDKMIQGELNFRSYTALYKLNASDVTIYLKLFSDHEHKYEAIVTEPTCTEGGYTTYTCSCGDSYVADETPAKGHSYGEWITPGYVDELPCGATYTETRHCACGDYETRECVKEILWGDVNHDGVIDPYDATLILRYAVGKDVGEFCVYAADLDGDGVIDSYDATLILRYCVGKITKFPVEG